MDINKYIGVFLAKNNYCSLPGLGTLTVKKKGAVRLTTGEINPPSMSIAFDSVGSIDDRLPHFIALNENISTNNASNAISQYCKEVKEDIANGEPFIIEGVGRFFINNGKIDFTSISEFDPAEFIVVAPPPVEVPRAPHLDKPIENIDFKSTTEYVSNKPQGSSFAKILLPVLLIVGLGIGGYFGYQYINKQDHASTQDANPATADSTNTTNPVDTNATSNVATDTIGAASTTTATAVSGATVKVAILTYNNEMSAKVKCEKLVNNGNNATVQKADSTNYYVVITVPNATKPADQVADSLRRFFNPSERNGKVVVVK